jgi:hypothetical protein
VDNFTDTQADSIIDQITGGAASSDSLPEVTVTAQINWAGLLFLAGLTWWMLKK